MTVSVAKQNDITNVKPLFMENSSPQTFFPDLAAKKDPNKGGTRKATKHRSSQSQGAAGPSTSRPNSEAGTQKTYHNVIK